MNNRTISIFTILSLLCLIPLLSYAEVSGREKRRQGPPPEAIAACSGKSVGDTVSFTGRRGEALSATCKEIQGQIVAVPEGMQPQRERN